MSEALVWELFMVVNVFAAAWNISKARFGLAFLNAFVALLLMAQLMIDQVQS